MAETYSLDFSFWTFYIQQDPRMWIFEAYGALFFCKRDLRSHVILEKSIALFNRWSREVQASIQVRRDRVEGS